MSQTTQIAIPGPSTLATPSRTTLRGQQQNIPRFLLKLYEIVNDPANEALVKWSEAGDSFHIFDHERFAREILGKWFKHQNFSSFVRQLNLYGFRKITALQQGLLRTDSDSEAVRFAHPNFHRGQRDLLALIHRRRIPQSHSQTDDAPLGLLQLSLSQDTQRQGQGQAVDVRSIVDGINTIRLKQQAISADLNALKQSNDALWKEAFEARERHANHEATINRILHFLAAMFGRVIRGAGAQSQRAENAVPGRLFIGDGRADHGGGMDFGSDFDAHSEPGNRGHSPFPLASERFATIETPGGSVLTPATITEIHDPAPKPSLAPPQPISNIQAQQNGSAAVSPPSTTAFSTSFVVPTTVPNPTTANPEAMWQATLQQMLSSPEHFQQIFQTFATPTPSASPTSPVPAPSTLTPSSILEQQPLAYAPSAPQADLSNTQQFAIAPAPIGSAPQASALLDSSDPLIQHNRALTEIVDDRQTNLQTDLQALIYSMGLDPQNMTFPAVDHPDAIAPSAGTNDGLGLGQGQLGDGSDFSLDSWLSQLGGAGLPYPAAASGSPAKDDGQPEEDFSMFLDIPALDDPPSSSALSSPVGTKRKLDAAEVPEVESGDGPSSKKKR